MAKSLPSDWTSVPPGTRKAHLLGIAGAGMRSLAQVLLDWGWRLTGSDVNCESLGFLTARGAAIHQGHAAEHVPHDADLVVASDAVPADNPERRRAAELGIPVLSYFEALGRIASGRQGLAVAGTHGKSTTAAMLAEVLVRAGLDPTVIYGAAPLGAQSGGRAGCGPCMVVEACEYRANFLHLRPQHAVILGIEPDHFDFYRWPAQLKATFRAFAESLPVDGLLLAADECPVTRRVAAGPKCRVRTFGFCEGAHWSAGRLRQSRGRYNFSIFRRREHFCDVRLQVPGRHNVLNALAAAALAAEQGVTAEDIARGLEAFRGLHRRLETVGYWRGVTLVDDYAHHPTEVTATLQSVREMYPGRRLCCLFQPHQASRTGHLLDELAASLHNADIVAVAEIFRAREPPLNSGDVTAADLARKVRAAGTEVLRVHDPGEIGRLLETMLRPGDVLVTMGAGDIWKVCDGFVDRLREDRAAG